MGTYVNPGNEGFARILRERYVDKTGLISRYDSTLDTASGLVMVSRPRRFGKSFAAHSLVAFYSCGRDSRALFEGLDVSRPALLVELKWDRPVRAAIDQIRDSDHPAVLRDLGHPALLAGATYGAKTKEHACRIEPLG